MSLRGWRQVTRTVGPKSEQAWLNENLLHFEEHDITRALLINMGVPHPRAVSILRPVCERYHVTSLRRLFEVGMLSLHNAKGVGDATLITAAIVLDFYDYNVSDWIGRDEVALTVAIRAHQKRGHE